MFMYYNARGKNTIGITCSESLVVIDHEVLKLSDLGYRLYAYHPVVPL